MSQSIDMSAVTEATLNGSTVEKINLNGTEIWTEPASGVQINQFYGDVDNLHYVAVPTGSSYDRINSFGGGLWAYTHNGLNCLGFKGGSSYIINPLGSSSIDLVDGQYFHRVATFNSSGGLTSQAIVCTHYGYVAANVRYGIPASHQYDTWGFRNGNFYAAPRDCNKPSSAQSSVSGTSWSCNTNPTFTPTTDPNYSGGHYPAWGAGNYEIAFGQIIYRNVRTTNGTTGLIF